MAGGIDLSVVIHARGDRETLPMALAHLEVQTYPAARFEALIYDSGPPSPALGTLERYIAGAPVQVARRACPGWSAARLYNRALEEAQGRWLLFLDEELLAGPQVVEGHIAAQERHGEGAVAGLIECHPQVAESTFTRWSFPAGQIKEYGELLPFTEWRAWNLSLPKEAIVEAGGFDEDPALEGLEDVELAWRLHERGLRGRLDRVARAYAWRATTAQRERRREYEEGFAIHALLQKTGAEEGRARLLENYSRGHYLALRALHPICARVCGSFSAAAPLFEGACRRLFRYERYRGFRDAQAGRPRASVPAPESG